MPKRSVAVCTASIGARTAAEGKCLCRMRVVSSWVVSTVYWQCRVRVVRRTGDWDACRTPSWLLPLPLLRDHALEVYIHK